MSYLSDMNNPLLQNLSIEILNKTILRDRSFQMFDELRRLIESTFECTVKENKATTLLKSFTISSPKGEYVGVTASPEGLFLEWQQAVNDSNWEILEMTPPEKIVIEDLQKDATKINQFLSDRDILVKSEYIDHIAI